MKSMYPETGPLRRELYPKHMEFFRKGLEFNERFFCAANRTGKTEGAGGYETVCHLLGDYPPWWEGRRWTRPVMVWAAGKTSQTTRDIGQKKLLGDMGKEGTGLIPKEAIVKTRKKPNSAEAIESAWIKNIWGGESIITFKSYDQKRVAFEGTEQDVIWLDEEPSADIYEECLTRTMTTDGIVMVTATPLQGMSPFIMSFMEGGQLPDEMTCEA